MICGIAHACDPVRHDHRHRARSFGLVGEFPAVARAGKTRNEAAARRAAQRHEQASRFHQPAVLRDEIDRRVREFACDAQRARPLRQSSTTAPRSCNPRCERGRHRLVIAEMQNLVTNDLPGLVALAGDQQRVAGLQRRDAGLDRFRAIADIVGAFCFRQNGGADRGRIFAARIVVGDDDAVGILGRDRAHDRALARIAIAAGAEHHHQLAFGVRPQRLQRLRQRIRLVGVIDEDRRAVMFADTLQPSLGAFEMFQRREHLRRLAAGPDREPGGDQRILDLEFADQRQLDRVPAAAMFEHELLRKAFDGSGTQPNTLAFAIRVAADGDDPQVLRTRGVDHLLRAIMIGRNHGSTTGRNEIAEQPHLGAEVMRDGRMIIHVVARQIGEAAGGDAHAVEPELVEPVRGRLKGQMRDAVAGDFVELPVKRDRIRRRQRAVDGALRRYQPDGADAGGSMSQPLPDLARERCDRGLAAGAGDGGDRRGLLRIKSRRRQRQRATRIGCDDKRYRAVARTARGRRRPQRRLRQSRNR